MLSGDVPSDTVVLIADCNNTPIAFVNLLGYDGKNYNSLVTIEHESDDADFRAEIDITIKAMKLPFDSIWFITKDKMGNSTSMTYIDRARFSILTYLKDVESIEDSIFLRQNGQ